MRLPHRERLLRHVREVQRTVRSCAGCGLCCTAAYNTVQILPWEARRVAGHLRGLPHGRFTALARRLHATVRRFRLRGARALPAYTCAFLEPDMRCALPPEVKPVACLSFNPLTRDACDQQPEWFARAGAEAEAENRRAGLPRHRAPIPVAVLDALHAARGGPDAPPAAPAPIDPRDPHDARGPGAPGVPRRPRRPPRRRAA